MLNSSITSSNISYEQQQAAYIDSIKGLIEEKVKMQEEEQKIKSAKHLTFVDKCDAVKSVRSVSRTIEGLIGKEKERWLECQVVASPFAQLPY